MALEMEDHVFTLKQVSEKIRVHDQKIYAGFVDNKFGKAKGKDEQKRS